MPIFGPSYSDVVKNLLKAAMPVRQLEGAGRVAVTTAAGRIAALAFSNGDTNLLWAHPALSDTQLLKRHPEQLSGGIGGDRLWFSPEQTYHWSGKPDWQGFSNYKIQPAMDPGSYEFAQHDTQSVTLHARGQLSKHGSDGRVGFEVERTIRLCDSPLSSGDALMRGVDYVGIETSHTLRLADSRKNSVIDLWHLLQVPAGSVLIVPVKRVDDIRAVVPQTYALPGTWSLRSDHVVWRYSGNANAKMGLSSAVVTGRSAVLREFASDRWSMIVRDFPVDPAAVYADYPYGAPRSDQVFQAWDGYGFGEMEFHSPALDTQRGPRELRESDRLWVFGGPAAAITRLAKRLLDVDIGYITTT